MSAGATISQLFVYGTLLPGEVRWPILAPYVEDSGEADTIGGTLYDTGVGYPAWRREGEGTVHGRRFVLAEAARAEALEVLDEVEGAVQGLYRRVTVVTAAHVPVYVYEYGGGLALVPIPGGNWLSR